MATQTRTQKITPIELLSATLAEMTARAEKAERERDDAKRLTDEWVSMYHSMEKRAKEAECKLSAEIAEKQKLREALENAAATKCPADCPGKKGDA